MIKKISLSLATVFISLSFLVTGVLAQINDIEITASPAAQKSEYILPYPGILPDHLLYPIKMLRDKLMLLFVRDPLKKIDLYLLLSDKRLGAGKVLFESNKFSLSQTTFSKGEKYFESAVLLGIETQNKRDIRPLFDKLENAGLKHLEVLQSLNEKAPAEVKEQMAEIIKQTQNNLFLIQRAKK